MVPLVCAGLVYCVIAPIITPIALVYFLVCSLLYKYNALYVYTPRFQAGGNVRLFHSFCSAHTQACRCCAA